MKKTLNGGIFSVNEDITQTKTEIFTINEPSKLENIEGVIYSDFLVQCSILVDGKNILGGNNFELNMTQKTSSHDEFEIICYADSLESPNSLPLKRTREYLGQSIAITFKQFGKKAHIFEGIITGIVNDKFNNYEGNIIIKGNAPTILLENGLDCESYESKNLKSIIEKATEEYQELNFDINPRTKDIFPYTVQYKESDFNFLKRMSERYGEWFYYNGEKIVFGGTGGKELELLEDKDIERFEFRMKTMPQKFQYMAYNAKAGGMEEVNSEEISYGGVYNPYVVSALKASEKMYTKSPNMLYNQSLLESGRTELKSAVERQKKSRANVFEVYMKTTNPNIQLGDVVKLKGYMPGNEMLNTSDIPLESYRVTELKHYHNGNEYYNEVIGVPKDQEIPGYMNEEAIPECEEQSATVTDNNDPQGMGRIRVQFPWQKPIGEQSPWIRLTTPYAGKGKGMHVIPEIGEEVIVGFESGNAEKPFVIGAMFNGSGTSGHGGAGNYMKGLATASGSNLMFNDNTGSMNLADQGGASMAFDGAGNATTKANSCCSTSVGNDASVLRMDSAGNIELKGNTNIKLIVGGSSIEILDGEVIIKSDKIKLDGKELRLIGSERTEVGKAGASQGMLVNDSGDTYVNGNAKVKVEANKVIIKGASEVDIN